MPPTEGNRTIFEVRLLVEVDLDLIGAAKMLQDRLSTMNVTVLDVQTIEEDE